MKTIITMVLLLIVDQANADQQLIDVQHDNVRGVTCWIIVGTGISCLPDSALKSRATAIPSGLTGRASQANSAPENESFVAAPYPSDERFQL
ncbi:hypothetical protein SB759_07845 [Pseudomonas sp. SIMBA_059]